MVDKKINKTVSYLKKRYLEEVVSSMTERFNYKNVMEVPAVQKVVINIGAGEAREEARA